VHQSPFEWSLSQRWWGWGFFGRVSVLCLLVWAGLGCPGVAQGAQFSSRAHQYEVRYTFLDTTSPAALPAFDLVAFLDVNTRAAFYDAVQNIPRKMSYTNLEAFWFHRYDSFDSMAGAVDASYVLFLWPEPHGTCCSYSNGEFRFTVTAVYPPPLDWVNMEIETSMKIVAAIALLLAAAWIFRVVIKQLNDEKENES